MAHKKKITPASSRPAKYVLDKAHGYEIMWPRVSPLLEACRRVEDASFVYVIGETEDAGPLKIGVAKDPIARLRGMQTGNPRRLKIEGVLLGDRELEQLLHEMWEFYAIPSVRQRGKVDAAPGTEWFRPEIREAILPIIETAAEGQLKHLGRHEGGPVYCEDLSTIVRAAHGQHGVVATKRDEVRLLARTAGYVSATRKSRI